MNLMKTNSHQWPVTTGRPVPTDRGGSRHPSPATRHSFGFTLTELLVIISIMGVLAGFTIPVLSKVKEAQYKKVARVELERLATALEGYKAKYGAYPPGNKKTYALPADSSLLSQLYYELAGVTHNSVAKTFTTLDGVSTISEAQYLQAYGVGGVVNSVPVQGGSEDAISAKNFLAGLKPSQFNEYVTNNSVRTTMIVTSVGGPADTYPPMSPGVNPFRYVYPGVNNPNGYDLWVQLVIKGQTNLICNWSRTVQLNSPLP